LFIVLIHWRIRPTEEEAFRVYWHTKVRVENDDHLAAEFLSKPMRADEVTYPVDALLSDEPEQYISFVNVGIWKDEASFSSEIGKYIPGPGMMEDFEQYPRRRIPLRAVEWRRGKLQLPASNSPDDAVQ
jgi:hypothetical protein